jgi:hypothetical protein
MIYIFDLDGTIFDCSHRLHFIAEGKKKDWGGFFNACVDDEPIWSVIDVALALLNAHHKLVFVSGRSEIVRDKTEHKIRQAFGYALPELTLYMRRKNDHRPDDLVKREILERNFPDLSVIGGVFDDRNQVVKMWRSLGLKVFQVAEGEF